MTTQNWIDLALQIGLLAGALKAIKWTIDQWGVIETQKSKDKVELAKANFLTVGQVTDFLVRMQEGEKKIDGLIASTSTDKVQILELLTEQKLLIHDMTENFTDFLKQSALQNIKNH